MFNKTLLTALAALGLGSGLASAQQCGAPVNQLVGYGVGTTGGGSATPVVVSTCAQLLAAVKVGGVIHINGMLDGCGVVRLVPNTTVLGLGANSGLTDGSLRIYKVDNIIIRNLDLSLAYDGGDLIDIEQAKYIWIDHVDLSNLGVVGGKDDFDGLLDIKRASDWVTVSWTKFHDHWKGSLVGHSASNTKQDQGKLHVTYHHNSFTRVNSRLPSIRFGTGHIYSSCYLGTPTSGVNSREGAHVLVEQTYFKDTNRAIATNLDAKIQGFAHERNNIYVNSTLAITQADTFVPGYAYAFTPAANACACVEAFAGVGKI